MARNRFAYKDDASMVAQLIRNDEAAIRYVFYDHYSLLLSRNAAKATQGKPILLSDLIQELYLYISKDNWAKLRKYDPSMPFVNWFSVVSYRFFKDFSRSMIDSASQVPISIASDHSSAFGLVKTGDHVMMDILNALSKLMPPRDREILEALLLRDEEPEKVAARHQITVENLYNIKRRTLAKLIKNHLKEYQS